MFFLLFAIAVSIPVFAQPDTSANGAVSALDSGSHLRISLLTCGPGEEVWETFGHSCIRIIDSTKKGRARDVIYNYGFLDSSPENTVLHQFLTGRVQVYLATNTFAEFNYQYMQEKRSVQEQVLLLDDTQKRSVLAFLNNNLRRENRYYDYNTVYDNCSTRILGLFKTTFGNGFVPGRAFPEGTRLTFRQLTDRCGPQKIQHKYWFSFGMKILFGSRSDRVASNTEAMYLADYLMDGMDSATLNGRMIFQPKTTLMENRIQWPDTANEPVIMLWIIAALTISCLIIPRFQFVGRILSTFILVVTGIAGCYLVYFWAIEAEPCWKENFNVLWALPTNLIIPFLGPRIKAKYAIAGLSLIGVSILLCIFKIQQIPLFEIGSLLLTLVFIYGLMYRRAVEKINLPGTNRVKQIYANK